MPGPSRHIISGGAALVEGPLFDFTLVFAAYSTLVGRLAKQFGNGAAAWSEAGVAWPDPARRQSYEAWDGIRKGHDAAPDHQTVTVGPLVLRAYLLGVGWCVYHPDQDVLMTRDNLPVEQLDPTPCIAIDGGPRGDERHLLGALTVSAIARIVEEELKPLRLNLIRGNSRVGKGGAVLQDATVWFSHEAYGIGRGWMRARCCLPNGTEVPRRASAN
jgi:hypothetical protein